MTTRNYEDPSRLNWQKTAPRPLRTSIWYPVDRGTATDILRGQGPFEIGKVVEDSEIARTPAQFPLVVLSHGTGGSPLMLMWLGHFLAARGYLVAAVQHHGNSALEERRPEGFLLYWERAKDLKIVVDRILADPKFGRRVDKKRIAAAGFSLGGYTAIALGGGRFDRARYLAFCASPQRDFTCEPQPEFPDAPRLFAQLERTDPVVKKSIRNAGKSFRDKRIKAVFAIAPAIAQGLTLQSLRTYPVPLRVVVGDRDNITPPRTNAKYVASNVPRAELEIIPGATHYTFLSACTPAGRSTIPICRDEEGIDRRAIHERVASMAYEFFERSWATAPRPQ